MKREGDRTEVEEVVSGRSPATPAWSLFAVMLVIAALVCVVLLLVALAYVLA